jgi:F-type H+-transporting ATPase subunit alpha
MSDFAPRVRQFAQTTAQKLRDLDLSVKAESLGQVVSLADGVAQVAGLPQTAMFEVLTFSTGTRGLAVTLDEDLVGCVLLGKQDGIWAGSLVRGTGQVLQVPVGEALLGRVVDPLGQPLDQGPAPTTQEMLPIERPAPGVTHRQPVTEPLHTGTTAIDAMLPLGRGQRELIIGDRFTGKTAIAIDAVLSQLNTDVVCIYAAIGQRASAVNEAVAAILEKGPKERCLCVVAASDAAAGLQWIAPYAACAMAEYFMERGGHALLILDDLTKHAQIHRQIGLLLRKPPGREAYPGDVFYLHSRLLERAAKLSTERGGGSLTALPIAETLAGNLSSYIPTNLISITDGQIFLEPRLFHEGQKPAIDVGKSVSRVGGKTQIPVLRKVSETLRLSYAQFLELEVFTRFGGVTDEKTQKIIDRGKRVRAALLQPQFQPLSTAHQVALLRAIEQGALDELPVSSVPLFRDVLGKRLQTDQESLATRIENGQLLTDAEEKELSDLFRAVCAELAPQTDESPPRDPS